MEVPDLPVHRDKPLDVVLDKLPKDEKGFAVDYTSFRLGGRQETSLLVGWTPIKGGGVRDSFIVRFGKFSAQVVLLGSCLAPEEKKTFRAAPAPRPLAPKNTNTKRGGVAGSKPSAAAKVVIPANPVQRKEDSPEKHLIPGVSPPRDQEKEQQKPREDFVCGGEVASLEIPVTRASHDVRRETYVHERPPPRGGDVMESTPIVESRTETFRDVRRETMVVDRGARLDFEAVGRMLPPAQTDLRRQTFIPERRTTEQTFLAPSCKLQVAGDSRTPQKPRPGRMTSTHREDPALSAGCEGTAGEEAAGQEVRRQQQERSDRELQERRRLELVEGRKRQEELERKRQEELERKRQEELERKRQGDLERMRQEEELERRMRELHVEEMTRAELHDRIRKDLSNQDLVVEDLEEEAEDLSLSPRKAAQKTPAQEPGLQALMARLMDASLAEPINLSLKDEVPEVVVTEDILEEDLIRENTASLSPARRPYRPRVSDISAASPRTPTRIIRSNSYTKSGGDEPGPLEPEALPVLGLVDPRLRQLLDCSARSGALDLSTGSRLGDCSTVVHCSPARGREQELEELEAVSSCSYEEEQELEQIALARATSAEPRYIEQEQEFDISGGTVVLHRGVEVVEEVEVREWREEEVLTTIVTEEVVELEYEVLGGERKLVGERLVGSRSTRQEETMVRTPGKSFGFSRRDVKEKEPPTPQFLHIEEFTTDPKVTTITFYFIHLSLR